MTSDLPSTALIRAWMLRDGDMVSRPGQCFEQVVDVSFGDDVVFVDLDESFEVYRRQDLVPIATHRHLAQQWMADPGRLSQ